MQVSKFFKNKANLILALALVMILLTMGTVAAASSATIIELKGDVQVVRGGGDKAFTAFENMRLTEGDRIITGAKSSAKIELENDNAVISLTENTRIYLSELKTDGDDQQTSINLQSGGIGSKIKKALSKISRFSIKTPTATMGVRGTDFYTQYYNGEVDVRVVTGAVELEIGLDNSPVDEMSALPETEIEDQESEIEDPEKEDIKESVKITLTAMEQVSFREEAPVEEIAAVAPVQLELSGLDELFIEEIVETAQTEENIIPESILEKVEEAKKEAQARSEERQAQKDLAKSELEEKAEEKTKEVAKARPSTEEDKAPVIVDNTPVVVKPGETHEEASRPATSGGGGGSSSGSGSSTPKPADCESGFFKVTFSIEGGVGEIGASAFLDNYEGEPDFIESFSSGTCIPAGAVIGFSLNEELYLDKWLVNGQVYSYEGQIHTEHYLNLDPLEGPLEVKAVLKKTYKVTFGTGESEAITAFIIENEGETEITSEKNYPVASMLKFDANPEKGIDVKWRVNGEDYGTTDGQLIIESLDKNIIVAASFVEEPTKYTVTFKDHDGTELKTEQVEHGSDATAPADPARDGYEFTGWDKEFINITGDIEVTTTYTINQYTISFDSVSGSGISAITQDYGTIVVAPGNPTREGYTFDGWNPALPETMPANHLTVYAQWTPIQGPESYPGFDKPLITYTKNPDYYEKQLPVGFANDTINTVLWGDPEAEKKPATSVQVRLLKKNYDQYGNLLEIPIVDPSTGENNTYENNYYIENLDNDGKHTFALFGWTVNYIYHQAYKDPEEDDEPYEGFYHHFSENNICNTPYIEVLLTIEEKELSFKIKLEVDDCPTQ